MIDSWAIQSALTKGKALSKGQCSRKSLQPHFSSMQMEWNFNQETAYYVGIGAVFSTSCTACPGPLMAWIKWSLEAMQDGLHPVVGPFNNPLPKGSVWDKLQGQPLTPGQQRAMVWTLQGDHEMFSNILKLPHWRSCWSCDAQQPKTKKKACPPAKATRF